MCGASLLYRIHRRLQDIKKPTHPDSRFGDVTIIAVGDLFQLPAVMDHKVFQPIPDQSLENLANLHGSLWEENFHLHELTTVVRQQNQKFAELLNHIRYGELIADDETVLLSLQIHADDPAHDQTTLHIYATNAEADGHNKRCLVTLQQPIYSIYVKDSSKDKSTGQLDTAKTTQGHKRSDTGGLHDCLEIAIGAIVKLTTNIDVADGLVNGVRGTVSHIIVTADGAPRVILIKFFDKRCGHAAVNKSPYKDSYPGAVPICKVEVHYQPTRRQTVTYSRWQFPLTLSWSSTIHSVQGLTVDKLVVDMSTIRHPGSAYVALSRCTTLDGLQIINFKKAAIKTDKTAAKEMERLRKCTIPEYCIQPKDTDHIRIVLLNVRGLLCHKSDVFSDPLILAADVICLTETHLLPSNTSPLLPDFHIYRQDRIPSQSGMPQLPAASVPAPSVGSAAF